MNALMKSLRNRIKTFLTNKTQILVPYVANTDPAELKVDDAEDFNIGFGMRNFPQATIYLPYSGALSAISKYEKIKIKIKSVDTVNNILTLSEPITVNIPANSYIQRTPNWEEVTGFFLGDPTSIPANRLPAVCVVPTSYDIQWYTLTGTKEKAAFNILVHTKAHNQDTAEESMVRITEDIVELLNSDLHLKIEGRDKEGYNRPFNSLVTNVSYAYSNKGQFCRTAQISWFGEEYWARPYVVNQDNVYPDPFP